MSYRRHYIKDGVVHFLDEVASGAVGIAKAVAHIDRADDATIESRQRTCAACPHSGGVLNRCNLCGCFVALKVTIKGERCPEGRW